MELGAIVCVPNGEPMCEICPWQKICCAHIEGREEEFPVRSEKKGRKIVDLTVLVLEKEGKYALRKRGGSGLLAGLWEFPNYEDGVPNFGERVQKKSAKHVFTHVEWHMTGYLIRAEEYDPQFIWATAQEIKSSYALPSAFKAFKDWIG